MKIVKKKLWNFCRKKKNIYLCPRRDGRVVECGGLENRWSESFRGFESLSLRHKESLQDVEFQPCRFFLCPVSCTKNAPTPVSTHFYGCFFYPQYPIHYIPLFSFCQPAQNAWCNFSSISVKKCTTKVLLSACVAMMSHTRIVTSLRQFRNTLFCTPPLLSPTCAQSSSSTYSFSDLLFRISQIRKRDTK